MASTEEVARTITAIDQTLEAFDLGSSDPALGDIIPVGDKELIRVNPSAEWYTGDGDIQTAGEKFQAPEVCEAYNGLGADEQRIVTTRMLGGLAAESAEQTRSYRIVAKLLAATVMHGTGRIMLAFEGRWREDSWEILWKDPDYQKVRKDVMEARSWENSYRNNTPVDEEDELAAIKDRETAVRARLKAEMARNLTALNITAAISAGKYHAPLLEKSDVDRAA